MQTVMVCLVSLLFAGPALAQQSQPQNQPSDTQGVTAAQPDKPKMGKGACKADVEQFCKDVEKGKIGDCLKQHKDELSADCKAARDKIHQMREKRAEKTQEATPVQPSTQQPAQQ